MPPSYANVFKKTNSVFGAFNDGDFSMKYFKVDTKVLKENGINLKAGEGTILAKITDGLEFGFGRSHDPLSIGRQCFKSAYSNDICALNCDLEMGDIVNPSIAICPSAVLGYGNWVGGAETYFNTSERKLTKSSLEFGYVEENINFETEINPNFKEPEEGEEKLGTEFTGSLNVKLNGFETAGWIRWVHGSGYPTFALGTKYWGGEESPIALSAKVNTKGHIGFGLTQKVLEGVSITLSGVIDTTKIRDPWSDEHKFRVGLELEA